MGSFFVVCLFFGRGGSFLARNIRLVQNLKLNAIYHINLKKKKNHMIIWIIDLNENLKPWNFWKKT